MDRKYYFRTSNLNSTLYDNVSDSEKFIFPAMNAMTLLDVYLYTNYQYILKSTYPILQTLYCRHKCLYYSYILSSLGSISFPLSRELDFGIYLYSKSDNCDWFLSSFLGIIFTLVISYILCL